MATATKNTKKATPKNSAKPSAEPVVNTTSGASNDTLADLLAEMVKEQPRTRLDASGRARRRAILADLVDSLAGLGRALKDVALNIKVVNDSDPILGLLLTTAYAEGMVGLESLRECYIDAKRAASLTDEEAEQILAANGL